MLVHWEMKLAPKSACWSGEGIKIEQAQFVSVPTGSVKMLFIPEHPAEGGVDGVLVAVLVATPYPLSFISTKVASPEEMDTSKISPYPQGGAPAIL